MPEQPGFKLRRIRSRAIVRLRVRLQDAAAIGEALQLPQRAACWHGDDPAACWLGPDQWLLTSDAKPAEDIVGRIGRTLAGRLHAAIDMSSGISCFSLTGPAARTILAMGCGIDLHTSAFMTGHCVRTRFANVALVIAAVADDRFDLYVDRSYARYLGAWIAAAGEDPVTCDSKRHD